MKFLSILFLLVMAKGCDPKRNAEMKKTQIEYTAISRGKYLNINIKDETLSIVPKRDADAKVYELKSADWKALADLYVKVDLEKLSSYKAPTEKRFYDGAAIASLRIVYEGKTYESVSFDHGNPPVEIADFVNKIVSFSKDLTHDN
ncbi:hypothetical protein [Flavobacterium sp. 3HN19-14]|uniref:hypothetical protein n=1 Tax=Flavobacterium sp. 3HN19-14 TaxID=3448133 RepID=UPI003EDEDCDF